MMYVEDSTNDLHENSEGVDWDLYDPSILFLMVYLPIDFLKYFHGFLIAYFEVVGLPDGVDGFTLLPLAWRLAYDYLICMIILVLYVAVRMIMWWYSKTSPFENAKLGVAKMLFLIILPISFLASLTVSYLRIDDPSYSLKFLFEKLTVYPYILMNLYKSVENSTKDSRKRWWLHGLLYFNVALYALATLAALIF